TTLAHILIEWERCQRLGLFKVRPKLYSVEFCTLSFRQSQRIISTTLEYSSVQRRLLDLNGMSCQRGCEANSAKSDCWRAIKTQVEANLPRLCSSASMFVFDIPMAHLHWQGRRNK